MDQFLQKLYTLGFAVSGDLYQLYLDAFFDKPIIPPINVSLHGPFDNFALCGMS